MLSAVLDVATSTDTEHRSLGIQGLAIVYDNLSVSGKAIACRETVLSLVIQCVVLVLGSVWRVIVVRTVPRQVQVSLAGDIEFLCDVPSS